MTISRRRDACNDLNHKIAAGLANDFTIEKLAEFTGTSLTTVKRYKADESIAQLEAIIRAANAMNHSKVVADLKEEFRERLKRLRPTAAAVYETAMTQALEGDGDLHLGVKAADSVIDRLDGKAKQPIEHEGSVESRHVVIQIPPNAVDYWLQQQQLVQGVQRPALIAGEPAIDV